MASEKQFSYTIDQFTGIDVSRGDVNTEVFTATDARNIATDGGRLETCKGALRYLPLPGTGLARRMFRFDKKTAGGVFTPIFVVTTDTAVYAYKDNAWATLYTGAQNGFWDAVTWEENGVTTLFMGNGADDNKRWDGVAATLQTWAGTPKKFGSLSVYKDRIWGSSITDEPESVYYSRAYQPTNWQGNPVEPSDAGGAVNIPQWRGDPVTGIRPTMDDLGVFRRGGMQRIINDDPLNFMVLSVRGIAGPVSGNALTTTTSETLFLAERGIGVYDGTRTYIVDDRKLGNLYALANRDQLHKACVAIKDSVFYAAFAVDGSAENNIALTWDMARQTYMLHEGVSIAAWGQEYESGRLLCCLNAGGTFRVCLFGEGNEWDGISMPSHWTTPWQDNQHKRSTKKITQVLLYGALTRADGVNADPVCYVEIENELRQRVERTLTGPTGETRLYAASIPFSAKRYRLTIRAGQGSRFSFDAGIEITGVEHDTQFG